MLYKVLLTFESVDEILISVSIQSYRAELFCGYVIMLYKFALTFEIKKLQSSTFMWWYLFFTLMVLSYDPDTIFRSSNWTQSTAALWPLKVKSLYQSITQNSRKFNIIWTSGMNSRDPINSIIGSLIYDFTDQTWPYVTSHPKTYINAFLFHMAFRLQGVRQPFEWLGHLFARNFNLFERLCEPFVGNINPFERYLLLSD